MRNMLAAIEKESQQDPATKTVWKFWDTQPVPKMSMFIFSKFVL